MSLVCKWVISFPNANSMVDMKACSVTEKQAFVGVLTSTAKSCMEPGSKEPLFAAWPMVS